MPRLPFGQQQLKTPSMIRFNQVSEMQLRTDEILCQPPELSFYAVKFYILDSNINVFFLTVKGIKNGISNFLRIKIITQNVSIH